MAAATVADAAQDTAWPPAKRARTAEVAEAVADEARGHLAELLLGRRGVESLAAIGELADDALAWATAHGVVMYKAPAAKAQAKVVPIALLPSPFDVSLYTEAFAMAPLFHDMMDRVACDVPWLCGALEATGKLDTICGHLLEICKRVYATGTKDYRERVRLHIMRNDFMLDSRAASRGEFALKQVELNMIAASFSTHAQDLTEVHRYLLSKYLHRVHPLLSPDVVDYLLAEALPSSPNAEGIAAALAEAHAAYEERWPGSPAARTPRVVLFVSDTLESNELDHRKLEIALFRRHGIRSLRRSLTQLAALGPAALLSPLGGAASAGASGLHVEGHEVTVAYFRTGYWPANYEPHDGCWAAREAIEVSEAVSCPSVPAQLAGMKKVQQLLGDPAVLRRFVPEPGQAALLGRAFARMGDPSGTGAEARACVEAALARPGEWVLKPQVEGSGELFFDADIPRVLGSRGQSQLAEFILMERLRPPVTPSLVFRAEDGCRAEAFVRSSVAELGVYGTFVASGARVLRNAAVGHLLRSKAEQTTQGGVFVGNAVVDAPLLLPPADFWRHVQA